MQENRLLCTEVHARAPMPKYNFRPSIVCSSSSYSSSSTSDVVEPASMYDYSPPPIGFDNSKERWSQDWLGDWRSWPTWDNNEHHTPIDSPDWWSL